MPIENDIQDVLHGLLTSGRRANAELLATFAGSPALEAAERALHDGNLEAFHFALSDKLEKLVDGLLEREFPNAPGAQFLCKQSQFIERHLRHLFERHEGSACCADKSRTVLRALLGALLTGKEIEFNYGQQYTYHLPKRILTTHASIVGFFNGLHALYYGNPKPYLQALADVTVEWAKDVPFVDVPVA